MKTLEAKNQVRLFEETLTDGSKVYNVGNDWIMINCSDKKSAIELFNILSNDSKVVNISQRF